MSKNSGATIRAEELNAATLRSSFVDPIGLQQLVGNANQLVFGRRGSGKTMLLKALEAGASELYGDRGQIHTVYVSLERIVTSNPRDDELNKVAALEHFNEFVNQVVLQLFEFAIAKGHFEQSSMGYNPIREAKFRALFESMVSLETLSRTGVPSRVPNSNTLVRSENVESEKSTSAESSLGFRVSRGKPKLPELGLKSASENKHRRAKRDETESTFGFRFHPGAVKAGLEEIVQMLDLDFLIIIVDEWIMLGHAQADFADYMRRALMGSEFISVKVAVDQYQCHLNNGGQDDNWRGIEIGADMTVACDLDRPFRSGPNSEKLLAEILYRRLVGIDPNLRSHLGDPDGFDHEAFVDAVFKNKGAFTELCRASNGLCRTFHSAFKSASNQLTGGVSSRRKITRDLIRTAAAEDSAAKVNQVIASLSSGELLTGFIFPYVRRTSARYFFTPTHLDEFAEKAVRELMAKRVVNAVPEDELHPSTRAAFRCYEIEYGLYVSLMNEAEWTRKDDVTPKATAPPEFIAWATEADVPSLYLSLDTLERAGERVCVSAACSKQFSVGASSYVKKGYCPHCFEPQGEVLDIEEDLA